VRILRQKYNNYYYYYYCCYYYAISYKARSQNMLVSQQNWFYRSNEKLIGLTGRKIDSYQELYLRQAIQTQNIQKPYNRVPSEVRIHDFSVWGINGTNCCVPSSSSEWYYYLPFLFVTIYL